MMKLSKLLLSVAALCSVFALNAEAKLFKWVDDKGITHYGETIPPEFANKEAMKFDKGRSEKRSDTRDVAAKKARQDPVAEKARIEAERHDSALVNTYSSEQEIDLARDRNLQQVEARTNSFTTLLRSAQENLVALNAEEAKITQSGRALPKSLVEDIAAGKTRIAKLQIDLDTSAKETDKVKARYEADKVRYRELKGFTPKK
ncbi:MAG: DUF4124 domain-containing protein [Sideroxydans sp.]|nr:DUF4124 domain-containing protein [Sideroxydans sp.]